MRIFGSQDVRLFRFQFRRHVALSVRDRRTTFVVFGHLLGRATRHLDEEAEYLVITHAQRFDARTRALFLFQITQPGLALRHLITQFVECRVVAMLDQAAFADQDRRMIHNGPIDLRGDIGHLIELLLEFAQAIRSGLR